MRNFHTTRTVARALVVIALSALPATAAEPLAPVSAAAAAPAPAPAPGSQEPIAEGRRSALTARMHLKVIHPQQVRVALSEAARKVGGHATRVTDQGVALKIPPATLNAFLLQSAQHGLVLEKSLARQDLTEVIADLEGRLRSKQEIFGQLRAFFDKSNLQATLDIERTMTALVEETESIKGQLRVERDRASWAQIEINFQFQPHDRLVYVNSPFEWLNSIDLERYLSEFEGDY